ncbi:NifB/NifX family molybdenum-iron cluster-binding protein [Shewanella halotolerans]|uniref:NifB/NifX family molybdenum-iron cluster-binding protein n=1 Tax=Shewanella halotolerans TaxID=2864204 RepID=UPI001C65F8A8|nr:NifB/NifX family molybdenum-iron cluster-binding protein [Shewanella halotolerans]QYJ90510.1 dinitrogenase iron-molybdenum cofactor biosynthesis protein [Shewanella halotolerans]
MIIAMPMSWGRLAAHFTKAQRIGFFNEYHQLITSFDNPAIGGGGCRAKSELLSLIKAQKTDIVIVQHIGERMLGKLLAAGISVSQGDNAESIEVLLSQTQLLEHRLLDASQGRASLNHAKKGGCCADGGGCCSSSSGSGASGGCGCGGHDGHKAQSSSLLQQSALHKAAHSSRTAEGEADKPISYQGFRPLT